MVDGRGGSVNGDTSRRVGTSCHRTHGRSRRIADPACREFFENFFFSALYTRFSLLTRPSRDLFGQVAARSHTSARISTTRTL